MDKYSGCNIVDTVVTAAGMPPPRIKKNRRFIVSLAIAAAAVGALCFLRYAPIPALAPVREAIKSVFCYDIFGRSDFGGSVFAGFIGA